jgi:hypothetical protein
VTGTVARPSSRLLLAPFRLGHREMVALADLVDHVGGSHPESIPTTSVRRSDVGSAGDQGLSPEPRSSALTAVPVARSRRRLPVVARQRLRHRSSDRRHHRRPGRPARLGRRCCGPHRLEWSGCRAPARRNSPPGTGRPPLRRSALTMADAYSSASPSWRSRATVSSRPQ